jgi:hypothetical protein
MPHPLTVAERSGFRQTSTHDDVLRFIDELQKVRPRFRVESMGLSAEGRDMPVLIFGDSGPTVLVLANIHAGEVEGKEAVLALARDLPDSAFEKLTVLWVPDYNPDGNDRIDVKHRALDLAKLDGQVGPEGGVGTRYTGKGINLNRDYMKQEAVESRHLSRLFARWNPHLTVDCHTTDGSIHGYALTYDTGHIPNPPCEWIRTRALPEVSSRLDRRTGLKTFFYGNFVDEKDLSKGWATYSHLPRYGSHYRGLRGRMDILLEAYSYIPFRERFVVTVEILKDILGVAAENAPEIVRLCDETARAWRPDPVGIAYAPPRPIGDCDILAWDPESQFARRVPGREIRTYRVPHLAGFTPSKAVSRPAGYLVPLDQREVIQNLRTHGVVLEELAAAEDLEAEVHRIDAVLPADSPDHGDGPRRETVIPGRSVSTRLRAEKGDVIVRTDQPLGTLACYLLEPESDDGLARWGLLDACLRPGGTFPIARLRSP